jgi:hypothetical protein
MNIHKTVVVFGIALLLAGCITSLHPFYTEKDLLFDPSLLGTWVAVNPEPGRQEEKEAMTWTFARSGEKSYDVVIQEKEFALSDLGPLMDQLVKSITRAYNQGVPAGPPDTRERKPEPGEPAAFEAHLVRLGKSAFMDIVPKDAPMVKNSFYLMQMVPVHTLWRISIKKNEVRLAMLDDDWFEKMIEQKKVTIGYADSEGRYILTASTEELQQFVVHYGKDAESFTPPLVLHRKK